MLKFLYKTRFLIPILLLAIGFYLGFTTENDIVYMVSQLFVYSSGYLIATIGYLTARKNAKEQDLKKSE